MSKSAAREGKGDQHAARGGGAITDNGRFSITATLLDNDKGPGVGSLAAGINEADRARMFVLRVAKVNCAPSSVLGIVERVASRYQTVTVALRKAGDQASAAQPRDDSLRLLALRDLVDRAAREGDVTKTTLADRHGAGLAAIGITKRALDGVLKTTVAQGYLAQEPRCGKGGGMRFLPGVVSALARAA